MDGAARQHRPRDLGTGALGAAVACTLLALAQPVATLTTTSDAVGRSVAGTSVSGWFGTVRDTSAGATTSLPGAVPALGWAVVAGAAVLLLAAVLRLRTGAARTPSLLGGAWLLTTGGLVLLHGRARAERVREVLTDVAPGGAVLHPSASPWLVVAGGALALLAVLARPRTPRAGGARRGPAPGVVEWIPVPERP